MRLFFIISSSIVATITILICLITVTEVFDYGSFRENYAIVLKLQKYFVIHIGIPFVGVLVILASAVWSYGKFTR